MLGCAYLQRPPGQASSPWVKVWVFASKGSCRKHNALAPVLSEDTKSDRNACR